MTHTTKTAAPGSGKNTNQIKLQMPAAVRDRLRIRPGDAIVRTQVPKVDILGIIMVVCDVNPVSARHGERRDQILALPGRRLERPPVRTPDQTRHRGPRKDARFAAGARHGDRHREDLLCIVDGWRRTFLYRTAASRISSSALSLWAACPHI